MTSNRHEVADRRKLSAKIAAGLILGIAFGLFVGERATVLQVIADGYIKLLQMTVLPYVTVSIVGGLGALNGPQGVALVKRVGLVLALLWAAAAVDGVPVSADVSAPRDARRSSARR